MYNVFVVALDRWAGLLSSVYSSSIVTAMLDANVARALHT
jgi:hypothetical protein